LTGTPLIVITIVNVRVEAIFRSPDQPYRCFLSTHMDALVVERCLLLKEQQPQAQVHETEAYLAQFKPD